MTEEFRFPAYRIRPLARRAGCFDDTVSEENLSGSDDQELLFVSRDPHPLRSVQIAVFAGGPMIWGAYLIWRNSLQLPLHVRKPTSSTEIVLWLLGGVALAAIAVLSSREYRMMSITRSKVWIGHVWGRFRIGVAVPTDYVHAIIAPIRIRARWSMGIPPWSGYALLVRVDGMEHCVAMLESREGILAASQRLSASITCDIAESEEISAPWFTPFLMLR